LVHIKQSLLLKRLDSKNQWQWWHFALCNGWLFYFPTEEVAQEFQLISFFDEARFEEVSNQTRLTTIFFMQNFQPPS
jgi:hypothetical protein